MLIETKYKPNDEVIVSANRGEINTVKVEVATNGQLKIYYHVYYTSDNGQRYGQDFPESKIRPLTSELWEEIVKAKAILQRV